MELFGEVVPHFPALPTGGDDNDDGCSNAAPRSSLMDSGGVRGGVGAAIRLIEGFDGFLFVDQRGSLVVRQVLGLQFTVDRHELVVFQRAEP